MGPRECFLLLQTLPTFWVTRILILRIFISETCWIPNSQTSRLPDFQKSGLGQAWARPGFGRVKRCMELHGQLLLLRGRFQLLVRRVEVHELLRVDHVELQVVHSVLSTIHSIFRRNPKWEGSRLRHQIAEEI